MSDWTKTTLVDIADITMGQSPKSEYYNLDGEGLPFLQGSAEFDSMYPVFKKHTSEWNREAPKNSILMSVRAPVGALNIAPIRCAIGRGLASIRGKNDNTAFLYYLLKYSERRLNDQSSGTVFTAINKKGLENFIVYIPPISEQKAIAHILGTLDDKIELNRRQNETLEAMAQALFKSWFVDFDPVLDNALAAGNTIPPALQKKAAQRQAVADEKKLLAKNPALAQLFPASFEFNEELGKWVPEGWEVKPFGELIEKTIGGDWGKEVPDDKHTEPARIIRGTDIPKILKHDASAAPLRFVEKKKLETRKLEIGDLVVEVSGGSPTQPTGRALLIDKNILKRLGGQAEPASFCRRMKPLKVEYSSFCYAHLLLMYDTGRMWEYQVQSTGIANFQTNFFLETEQVLIPADPNLLADFHKRAKAFRERTTLDQIDILTSIREALLPMLLSGKITINAK